MHLSACPASSDLIETCAQAREYYRLILAGSHSVTSKSKAVDIVFEGNNTHVFSVEVPDINAIPEDELVTRDRGDGTRECRQFALVRARLMDSVLPAISSYDRCALGKGPPHRANREIYGPCMPCGRHMKVVLRPGPKTAWTCVTAFPVTVEDFRKASWHKPAQFP